MSKYSSKYSKYLLIISLAIRLLIAVRQQGYIHPDEFMQSTEISAGDVLSLKSTRTWEWMPENTLRSFLFPYISSGFLYALLKWLGIELNSHQLLNFPRIWMTLLSFMNDLIIYKICLIKNKAYSLHANILFAISHVAFVFATRTFSNSIELLLFNLLLHLALDTCKDSKKPLSTLAKVTELFIPQIMAFGLFIRPTFVFFSFIPIFVWFFYIPRFSVKKLMGRSVKKAMLLIPQFSMCCFAIAIIDSLYYGRLTFDKLSFDSLSSDLVIWTLKNITWTPFNFVMYNANNKNLVQHGIHPWYLHTLVNVPILFGVYGIIGLLFCINEILKASKRKFYNQTIDRYRLILTISALFPLMMLSICPHHEARYILPMVTPLILLTSETVNKSKLFFVLNIIHSFMGLFILGHSHQGGLTPCMHHLNSLLQDPGHANSKIIFYNTYMPPTALLLLPNDTNVIIKDFAGMPNHEFLNELRNILEDDAKSTYLVVPFPKLNQIHSSKDLEFVVEQTFFPHASFENLPDWKDIVSKANHKFGINKYSFFRNLQLNWSLILLSVRKK